MNNSPPANIRVDWLSFTVKLPAKPGDHSEFQEDITTALRYRFPMLPDMTGSVAQGIGKRDPYTRILQESGVTILFNPSIPHFLVEISGTGCEKLGHDHIMNMLMTSEQYGGNVMKRLTRLDIALDIETPIRPAEITSAGYSGRFKAENYRNEASGETHYIGSPDSDRMCRVYRYNDPHPRSHLLRFEYVTRRTAAKAAAQNLIDHGLEDTLGRLAHVFAWKHPAANQYDTGKRIARWEEPNKSTANTMRWIYNAVYPALERLEHSGVLSDVFWQDFAQRFPRSQQKPPTPL